jgi:hypothetical protein
VRTFSVPHYYAPPSYPDKPTYAPIVGCSRYSIIASVSHEADHWSRKRCTFRVRVWPSGVDHAEEIGNLRIPVASSPVDFHWRLTKQPEVRPACYEDDPMQAGVSSGPPGRNCWMVDEVSRCWDGGDDGDDRRAGGTPDGGSGVRLPSVLAGAPTSQLCLR